MEEAAGMLSNLRQARRRSLEVLVGLTEEQLERQVRLPEGANDVRFCLLSLALRDDERRWLWPRSTPPWPGAHPRPRVSCLSPPKCSARLRALLVGIPAPPSTSLPDRTTGRCVRSWPTSNRPRSAIFCKLPMQSSDCTAAPICRCACHPNACRPLPRKCVPASPCPRPGAPGGIAGSGVRRACQPAGGRPGRADTVDHLAGRRPFPPLSVRRPFAPAPGSSGEGAERHRLPAERGPDDPWPGRDIRGRLEGMLIGLPPAVARQAGVQALLDQGAREEEATTETILAASR